MDKVTQENAEMVDETMSAANSLRTETERLAALVGTFKIDEDARPGQLAPRARSVA